MSEHNHRHPHEHGGSGGRGLAIAFLLTIFMMGVEFIGGWLSNSLALVSDAGHMLTDALALGLSLAALRFAMAPATQRKTYGFHRLEILAALVNGTTLIVLAFFILSEAWRRFGASAPIETGLMLAIAVTGLIVNAIGLSLLHEARGHNLNVRGAFLHMMGDLLSSVAVIVTGFAIRFTGWTWLDPVLSALIACVIVVGAIRLLKESVDILLEATPVGVEVEKVIEVILSVPSVTAVHDVHVWALTSGVHAMSAHVVVGNRSTLESDKVIAQAAEALRERFAIAHTTLQVESAPCEDAGV